VTSGAVPSSTSSSRFTSFPPSPRRSSPQYMDLSSGPIPGYLLPTIPSHLHGEDDRNSDSSTVSSPPSRGRTDWESSKDYPSWIPRSPPPAPIVRSSVGALIPPKPTVLRPTPREIRIVSVADAQTERDDGQRELAGKTRAKKDTGREKVGKKAERSETLFSFLLGRKRGKVGNP